jgi:hypothetical protein
MVIVFETNRGGGYCCRKGFRIVRKVTGVRVGLILFGCLLLASCRTSTSGPVRQFTKGTELAFYDFSQSHSFEEGAYGPATLRVTDGYYQIDVHQGDNELWWGQWGDTYGDVVIDVDVNQITERNDNAYGVMCRVRGTVGQTQTPDSTLAAIMNATAEVTSTTEATAQATDAATATQEATASQEAATATEPATAQGTEAASPATESATESSEAAVSQATEAQATEAQSTESSATAEATTAEAATSEATESSATAEATATEPVLIPTLEITEAASATPVPSPTPPVTSGTATPVFTQGDGYLFLIQGSGSFAIMRASGRNLTPLVNWTASDKIHLGPGQNHVRAVCMGTYLAFYANDSFLADATDDSYGQGQVGLVASAANRLGLQVNFDNLTVSAANPG